MYPAMQPVTRKEDVEEGKTEHDLARNGLDEMIELAPDTPGFGAALAEAKGAEVEGAASMNKNELADALAEKMG